MCFRFLRIRSLRSFVCVFEAPVSKSSKSRSGRYERVECVLV